ncbi:MAG: AraC family transcriptional regulator [Spirochaetota bacterium]
MLDPIYNNFKIPSNAETKTHFRQFMRRAADGTLAFAPETAAIGMYPIWYAPAQTNEELPHSHSFLELIIVTGGRGKHRAAGKTSAIAKGDVVFINNALPHCFAADDDAFSVIAVSFLPSILGYNDVMLRDYDLIGYHTLLVPFGRYDVGGFFRMRPPPAVFTTISFIAFHLIELFFADASANRISMAALLKHILSLMRTHHRERYGERNAAPLAGILDHIHGHYRERITLSSLARRFAMNPTYLSTKFNRIAGKSLSRYINELRIHRAEALIAETDIPIRAVAAAVGYETLSHFNRAFRAVTGHAPRDGRGTEAHRKSGKLF